MTTTFRCVKCGSTWPGSPYRDDTFSDVCLSCIAGAGGHMVPSESQIAGAREVLARQIDVSPGHLEYKGVMHLAPGMPELLLFNVTDQQHPRFKSTLSVRVA